MFTSIWQTLIASCLILSVYTHGAEPAAQTDWVQQQKDQLDLILVDMNQTGSALYDTFTAEPQGVVESGCLGDLRSINLDVITIDPANLLAAVYATLKDEMYSLACEAASDHLNKITEKLEKNLELPHGLGSINISQDTGIGDGSGGVTDVNVELDSDKVAADITEDILGEVRVSAYDVRQNLSTIEEVHQDTHSKPLNSKALEKKLENIIDIDSFWGTDEEDKPE